MFKDLDDANLMDAKEAAKMWHKNDAYIRTMMKQSPEKFPKGTIRKFGTTFVVTTEGMEAATGIKKSDL